MKICLAIDSLPGYHKNWGGAEMVGSSLINPLQKQGQDVFVLTSKFDFKKNDSSKNIFQIKTIKNGGTKLSFLFSNLPTDIVSIFYSIWLLKKIKPDIVHFHGKKLFLPVTIACVLLKIPTVFTVHDHFIICPKLILIDQNDQTCNKYQGKNCAECFTEGGIKKIGLKLFFSLRRSVFDYFLKRSSLVLAITEISKKRLMNYGLPNDKIKVLYQYQINTKNLPEISNKEPQILFSGAIGGAHKGLHIAIEAIKKVSEVVPNAKIIVAGTINNKSYQDKIDKLVEDLNIQKNIEFLGHIENKNVIEIMAKSTMIIVPEQWQNDPAPIFLLEAMILGKPIVASNIGGIPEFVKNGENGFLIEHNNPEQFAEKIIYLFQNPEKADLMGKDGKKFAKLMSNNDKLRKLIDLYKKITKS